MYRWAWCRRTWCDCGRSCASGDEGCDFIPCSGWLNHHPLLVYVFTPQPLQRNNLHTTSPPLFAYRSTLFTTASQHPTTQIRFADPLAQTLLRCLFTTRARTQLPHIHLAAERTNY